MKQLSRIALIPILVMSLFVSALQVSGATAITKPDATPIISTLLPIPQNLTASNNDNNSILAWDSGAGFNNGVKNPGNSAGYKISWTNGVVTTTALTTYRTFQAQPLVNGVVYTATVQSVDSLGNLSQPSQPITFTGDPSRVDALRKSMTGFFDDFNRPQGAVDSLKWASAYSECNDPMQNGFFINSQFHVHNMIFDKNCDRGQSISRPRATFDFTGRTGKIVFDMDGEFRRDQWYLDLVPRLMDIGGQVNIESGQGVGDPGDVLRFHQNEQGLEILFIDATGNEHSLGKADLTWTNQYLVPNVRRHFELDVSQSQASIVVDGVNELTVPLTLDFSKATVLWNEFSYNTPKSNEVSALVHWDNFGFDGPAPTVETHDYLTANYGADDFMQSQVMTSSINIPDVITGNVASRLMFTLQMANNIFYQSGPNDKIIVNGLTLPLPAVTGAVNDPHVLVSTINPYSEVINLPDGALHTDTNLIEFDCVSCGVKNVHTEIDFDKSSSAVPAYTQPNFNAMAITMMSEAVTNTGPASSIDLINGNWPGTHGFDYHLQPIIPITDSAKIHLSVSNAIQLAATGKNTGIGKVDLQLDHNVIATWNANGAPSFDMDYILDTSLFSEGKHELYLVAYNPGGVAGMADYFESHTAAGDYYPVVVNIHNTPVNAVINTPVTTTVVVPTPMPTALPTPINPKALHAQGNKLVDGNGNTVVLHGVDRDGSEYACEQGWGFSDGPVDLASFKAMAAWGINVVRIPLNEHCWLGLQGIKPEFSGVNYQQAIQAEVKAANDAGLYAILDLHASGPKSATGFVSGVNGQQHMADSDYSIEFWRQVATSFKDNSQTIFDLFNEPFNIDWNCWKSGCQTLASDNTTSYQTASMQQLVDAVRNAGATQQVLMLGGLSWSSDETQWEANKLVDLQNNLAVSFHLYQFGGCLDVNCFQSKFNGVQQKYPVIAGEIGTTDCSTSFLADMLNWLDSQGASYLAWTWDTWSNCQQIVTDYSGVASQPYGQAYKDHLASLSGNSVVTATVIPTATTILPTPTPTATNTPTIVVMPTPTATNVPTATNTPTVVPTPTATNTVANTVTALPQHTYKIPFVANGDNTILGTNTNTTIRFTNVSASTQAVVSVVFYDASGKQVGTAAKVLINAKSSKQITSYVSGSCVVSSSLPLVVTVENVSSVLEGN